MGSKLGMYYSNLK